MTYDILTVMYSEYILTFGSYIVSAVVSQFFL